MVNSYDAPIVDSGYDSILLEEDHASNFELNAPQPVPPPENFPANIEGGGGARGGLQRTGLMWDSSMRPGRSRCSSTVEDW